MSPARIRPLLQIERVDTIGWERYRWTLWRTAVQADGNIIGSGTGIFRWECRLAASSAFKNYKANRKRENRKRKRDKTKWLHRL